jgi:hypothetical protein
MARLSHLWFIWLTNNVITHTTGGYLRIAAFLYAYWTDATVVSPLKIRIGENVFASAKSLPEIPCKNRGLNSDTHCKIRVSGIAMGAGYGRNQKENIGSVQTLPQRNPWIRAVQTSEMAGEPDTSKGVRPVLREGCGNLPWGKASQSYPILRK